MSTDKGSLAQLKGSEPVRLHIHRLVRYASVDEVLLHVKRLGIAARLGNWFSDLMNGQ